MDLNKLSNGDRVVAGAGILFLISMFMPWWGLGGFDNTGTDYFLTGWLPLLIIIAMVAVIAIQRFSTTELPALPLPWSQVFLIAGAVVGVLLLLRTAITSSEEDFGISVDLERQWGLYIALLAALGVAAGGFLKYQEGEDTTASAGTAPPTPF